MNNFAQTLFRSVVPGILLVLLTGGIVLDVLITERLEEDFDDLMVAKSMGILALVEEDQHGVEMENYSVTLPAYAAEEDADYFQLVSDRGEVIFHSSSLDYWLNTEYPLPDLTARDNQEYMNLLLPDGRPGRLMRLRFVPRLEVVQESSGTLHELDARLLPFPGNKGGTVTDVVDISDGPDPELLSVEREALTLQLAISRDSLNVLAYKVHLVLILSGLAITASIIFLARRSIFHSVRPLQEMTSELQGFDEKRFDQRLTPRTSVTELHDLTNSINVLLSRVESTFNHERRFSGDVAHELRTPLAELRTLLDVSERWPDDPDIQNNFAADVREISDRMQRIVEALLQLSRSEQGHERLVPCPSLNQLVYRSVDRQAATAAQRRITLNVNIPDRPLPCNGLDQWQSIVGNLIDNAVDYATEGSHVGIRLRDNQDGKLELQIDNQTDNLSEADLELMYQRLWRKDPSRTSGLHSGLGLALVLSCCQQVGAEKSVTLDGDRLITRITAPILQPASLDSDAERDDDQGDAGPEAEMPAMK